MAHDGCERCFYCEAPLAARHEHDHFPLPQRHGGLYTVAACMNCHERKDRMLLDDWIDGTASIVEFNDAFQAMPASGRLFIGKVIGLLLDTRAELEAIRAEEKS